MTQAQYIQVQKTARYYLMGQPGPHVRKLWYVLHGYGQLAASFIKDFEVLLDGQHLIIAPEALNHFYMYGGSGPVGASWMTKEDRQHDIDDYIRYLDALHETIIPSIPASDLAITILGFSQGVATACRWLANGNIPASRLILWGSSIPTDLPFHDPAVLALFQSTDLRLVNGTNDPIFKSPLFQNTLDTLSTHQIPHRAHTFEGQHLIKPSLLTRFQ